MLTLLIGNKNYSSWSMRPWLVMTHAGMPFTEQKLRLSFEPGSDFKKAVAKHSPAGRVPVLMDGDLAVWDTLAILEFLAESHPHLTLWPTDRAKRARARSMCADMHAGFMGLRSHCPMNLEAELQAIGPQLMAKHADLVADLKRMDELLAQSLASHGGPWLMGAWSMVDAYFAPVATRLRTYGLPVSAPVAAYVDHIHHWPAFKAWREAALSEHDFIVDDEPYRSAPTWTGASSA